MVRPSHAYYRYAYGGYIVPCLGRDDCLYPYDFPLFLLFLPPKTSGAPLLLWNHAVPTLHPIFFHSLQESAHVYPPVHGAAMRRENLSLTSILGGSA